jgi:hypothetical protein
VKQGMPFSITPRSCLEALMFPRDSNHEVDAKSFFPWLRNRFNAHTIDMLIVDSTNGFHRWVPFDV